MMDFSWKFKEGVLIKGVLLFGNQMTYKCFIIPIDSLLD